jgi:serine/threonine protein kinase
MVTGTLAQVGEPWVVSAWQKNEVFLCILSHRWSQAEAFQATIESNVVGVALPQPIPFGKYTLFERIGRGGMADVFKARIQGPAGFERTFVVKRILPHLSDDPAFTKMFIDEAKIAAKLTHPNIVQVFELGNVDGEYFMSMEYVRGHDLAETMRTLWARVGPPRPELVAYVGREMCRALAYAHDFTSEDGESLGMIHRDISPSNVMLSYDGAVKILDFGIAKALGGDAAEEATKSGTLKGKFAYMAPEQTASNDIDRRIDIFATGIVLHEILTGRRLFKGENDMQTIERVRRCEVVAPSLFNPLCPPQLDHIVLQALAKNPDERYQSASEMADALDDIVYATRFQSTQLAQTMRGLFPADAGGGDLRATGSAARMITGSVSPSRSHTGVPRSDPHGSRPNPTATRSPTIPAIVAPAATSPSYRLPPSNSNISLPQPAPAGFLTRPLVGSVRGWVAIVVVLLLGFAFVGGAIWTLRTPIGSNAAQNAIPKIVLLDLAFESSPIGSDVYIVGSNEYLGRTPFRRKVEYRDDRSTFVVFRLAGYVETTKEVRPDFAGAVTLRPVPPAATAPNAPARPAPTPDPSVPPAVAPIVPAAPTGKTEAWDKEKPNKGHGKPHGKGKRTEAGDSFDMTAGKTPPSGPKASPFD